MLAALWAALRVYAVGVAVTMVQLLRRLRGGFRPPGKPGSQRGRRGSRPGVVGNDGNTLALAPGETGSGSFGIIRVFLGRTDISVGGHQG